MCHTLMSVQKVVWIIIEDSQKPTDLVTKLIQRCNVEIVHLAIPTSSDYRAEKGKPAHSKSRGVEQRNAGLNWLRENYSSHNCSGVFYFGDDDNKYDLRLFEDVSVTSLTPSSSFPLLLSFLSSLFSSQLRFGIKWKQFHGDNCYTKIVSIYKLCLWWIIMLADGSKTATLQQFSPLTFSCC